MNTHMEKTVRLLPDIDAFIRSGPAPISISSKAAACVKADPGSLTLIVMLQGLTPYLVALKVPIPSMIKTP